MYKVTINNHGHETVIHSPFFNDVKLVAGEIKQEINVADGFTFSVLPNNPAYNLIRPLTTLIYVDNTKTGKREFDGRVLMPTESMSDSGSFAKSFLCESELGYLNDSRQRHGEYHDITVRDFLQVIIDNHNADVADDPIDKTFEIGIVEVDSSTGTLYRYLGYENTFETIKDKLLDRLGGELRVRKENGVRYLDYLWSIGEHKTTEIRIAKNLKSITKEVDPTEYITRLIPLGERIESEDEEATDASEARLTIESVNGGKDYIVDHETEKALGTIVVGTQVWDDITQPNILKTRGQQWLAEQNRMKVQHTLTALDLSLIDLDIDSFDVGNSHPVINPIMGIDDRLRVVGKSIDIINPENNELDIGDQFKKASEYQFEAKQAEKKVVALESTVARQNKRVKELSKASIEAQKEIQILHDIIENMDIGSIDETLDLIVQQLIEISESITAIGFEITELELRINLLEDFRSYQELINDNFEERLLSLENKEEGDMNG